MRDVPPDKLGATFSLHLKSSSTKATTMTPPNRSLRHYRHMNRPVLCFLMLIAGICVFFGCTTSNLISPNVLKVTNSPNLESDSILWMPIRKQGDWKIVKATMYYESGDKTQNARILTPHDFHNEYFRYETHTLRMPIVRGALNRFLYLQSLVIKELQKPIEQRMEWILYFDTAIVLANPHIPLHHFLPPITDVETFKSLSIIATKSESDHLNSSVFFIRISGGSLRILTQAMETMYDAPYIEGYKNEDNDGGLSSVALQNVLYLEQHRDEVIFQPQQWYNSTTSLFNQPYFPTPAHRLTPDLKTLTVDHEEQQMFPETADVHRFWRTASEARRVLDEAKEKGYTDEQGALWEMANEVKEWVQLRAWDMEELERRIMLLRASLNDD
ncbi:hypothetical protein IG631_02753 [Alternaria alternata]|nr:hypothetical protein IG631_02753 [Alternaria alternata]